MSICRTPVIEPPAPDTPLSTAETTNVASPLKADVGVNVKPSSARLMLAMLPEIMTLAEPSPTKLVKPLVLPNCRIPLNAERLTVRFAASTSLTMMALVVPAENTSGVSTRVPWRPGPAIVGASLFGVTVTCSVSPTLLKAVAPPVAVMAISWPLAPCV